MKDQKGALTENVSEIKGGVNQRMNMLINKGEILRDLVTHPVALELAEHVLGATFLLSSFTANIAKKAGCLSPSIVNNEENGGTRLVPSSHLLPDGPDSSVPYKVPTIAATGPAVSSSLKEGLCHGTGQNLTDEARIGLLTFYVRPQFRQNENFFLGLDPAVVEQSPERLLDLLGYTTWFHFGQTDALSSRKRLRAREPWIPELRLKTP
ncbi:hypothetical protein ABIB75_008003 [Bradyrhizobium sp. GM2.2]|uniref:phytanoyl-CoA dioxygenase family protein n=1 Tax=Bradyrhizobium sp. GM2.2 TaxID=3156358 RepID=UPI00339B0B76